MEQQADNLVVWRSSASGMQERVCEKRLGTAQQILALAEF
jgi:hypothetical protein